MVFIYSTELLERHKQFPRLLFHAKMTPLWTIRPIPLCCLHRCAVKDEMKETRMIALALLIVLFPFHMIKIPFFYFVHFYIYIYNSQKIVLLFIRKIYELSIKVKIKFLFISQYMIDMFIFK